MHLDNGVPVYSINTGEQEVIKLELMYKAGKWFETKNLIADLTNRLLREGTSKHSAKQVADEFDFYGANLNTGAGFETAGVVLYTLSKYTERLIPLLHEIFTDSIFPDKEFETITANRKQKLAVDLQKNDFIGNRNFVNALFGQAHPYGRVTEMTDFSNINTGDLRAFFKQYYNSANLTILLSGKFDRIH